MVLYYFIILCMDLYRFVPILAWTLCKTSHVIIVHVCNLLRQSCGHKFLFILRWRLQVDTAIDAMKNLVLSSWWHGQVMAWVTKTLMHASIVDNKKGMLLLSLIHLIIAQFNSNLCLGRLSIVVCHFFCLQVFVFGSVLKWFH